jgi:hypothetical protein
MECRDAIERAVDRRNFPSHVKSRLAAWMRDARCRHCSRPIHPDTPVHNGGYVFHRGCLRVGALAERARRRGLYTAAAVAQRRRVRALLNQARRG